MTDASDKVREALAVAPAGSARLARWEWERRLASLTPALLTELDAARAECERLRALAEDGRRFRAALESARDARNVVEVAEILTQALEDADDRAAAGNKEDGS